MAGIVYISPTGGGISKIKSGTKTTLSGVIIGDGITISSVTSDFYIQKTGIIDFVGIQSYDSHKSFTSDTQLIDKKYVDDVVLEQINILSGSVNEQINILSGSVIEQINYLSGSVNEQINVLSESVNEQINILSGFASEQINILSGSINEQINVLSESVTEQINYLSGSINEQINHLSGSAIGLDTINFNGLLSINDNQVQHAFDTLDKITTTNIPEGNNLYYTDARARASISESILGISYNSGTGNFTLDTGYVIPTTNEESNWNTAYLKTHDQNTDTGTISSTFILDSDAEFPLQLKNVSGTLRLRNNTDSADANLIVGDLVVNGLQTVIHSTVFEVDDNTITVNANVSGVPVLDGGIIVERGTEINASLLWKESTNKWVAGLLNSEDIIWTAGTDGAESGLDADLLDGQHGSYYAISGHPHYQLSNLDADDHTQYIRVDGTRNFTDVVSYDSDKVFVTSTELVSKGYVDTQDALIPSVTHEPTGFVSRTDSTISFDSGTRTFTISPTSTTFEVWVDGIKYEKETCQVVINDVLGLWYIYFLTNGTLACGQTVWNFVDGKAPVATVYWNGTTGILADERHGIIMDGMTHRYLHYAIGVRYISGLVGTFTDTSFSISNGIIYDEDIRIEIPTTEQCRVFYRGSGFYKFTSLQGVYYLQSSNILQYDNDGTLASVDNNKYIAMWVFATNTPDCPIHVLVGQRQDTTIANARLYNTYESLVLYSLPSHEMKVIYRVIIQRTGTSVKYIETQDLRSISNVPSSTYVPTSHSNLSGLLNDDHLQYLRTDGTRELTGNWDAGSYKITAATFESDVVTGTAPLTVASSTLVTNLNADLLDGKHSSDIVLKDDVQYIELTSGGITTLHTHPELIENPVYNYSFIVTSGMVQEDQSISVIVSGIPSLKEETFITINGLDLIPENFSLFGSNLIINSGCANVDDYIHIYSPISKHIINAWYTPETYPLNPHDYYVTVSNEMIQENQTVTVTLDFAPQSKENLLVFCNGVSLHPEDYSLDGEIITFPSGIVELSDELVFKNSSVAVAITQTDISSIQSPFNIYHDGTDGHIICNSGDLYIDTVNVNGGITSGCIRSHGKIYNAVWNDFADFWNVKPGVQTTPGLCYADYGEGLEVPHKRGDSAVIGIYSDTYGYGMGERAGAIPIAVSGFCLAYVDRQYPSGTLLTNDTKGMLRKASLFDILFKRVVAKYIRPERAEYFNGTVKVNGRHWVKVI